jgi:hypothetical protein
VAGPFPLPVTVTAGSGVCEKDGFGRPFLFGINDLVGFSEELRDTGMPSCAFRREEHAPMKYTLLIALAVALAGAGASAQTKIWRCGNTYTNNPTEGQAKGCKPLEGGGITVVEGTKVNATNTVRVATAPQSGASQRIDADGQRARDADARAILEAELKKAEARQAELAREYNNGEPEKLGPETRNYQKYLDRVAELKASIARNENDIAGIKRELGRLPASK